MWNYNPAPVYGDVSFWVMLVDSTGENYAQVGWGKTEDNSVEYVFSEFLGENGWERWFYDAEDDEWVETESTQPPSSKSYKVTWVEGTPGDHQIQIVYDGSTSQNVTVSWTAVGYHVTGEVHNYQSVVGTDKGDHSPGHGGVDGVNANRIHAENIQAYGVNGGGWADISGYTTTAANGVPEGNMSRDTTSVSGVGFRIWDNRCEE